MASPDSIDIAIIGAGPTGLGAGYRLKELGYSSFKIFEARSYAGGLASSFQDDRGFWWDIGGHVQFSHYSYFDELMDLLLPDQWLEHERESWVWILQRFVPYPFQLNIHRLPRKEMYECLDGLIKTLQSHSQRPKNFEEWILQTSGEGIAKYFLLPYNFKVWAHSPKSMNSVWVGERVAKTDLKKVVHNILENKDEVSWGPNSTFRFPLEGGTGAIWTALAEKVGYKNIELNKEVEQIDSTKKRITFRDGSAINYTTLVSTMPLDKLVLSSDLPDELKDEVRRLKHSTTYVIGVGLEGKPKPELKSKCWMYFPEENCPFYRVTLFSKYSPNNVPDITRQWSLMCEVSQSEHKPVNKATIIEETIQGLRNTKLISTHDKVISKWLHIEEYGYPTPSIERDEVLLRVQPELMKRGIYSRGRFGMWKYEVSNQDHSLMQGVEAANHIALGVPELTAWYPEVVNGPKPY